MADESKTPAQQDEHQHKEGVFSTLAAFFGEHKIMLIGIIGGAAIVALVMAKSQSNASNNASTGAANQQGSLAGNQDANTASSLTNLQTQLDNLRNTLGTIAQGPAGPQGPQGPAGPSGGSTPSWWTPLLPKAPESSMAWGQKVTVGNTTYLTGWGAGNRLWGVPYKPGMTQQQWYNVPIGGGVGQKVLISDVAPKPALMNSQSNHSPMLVALTLSQNAAAMSDLSHAGPGGGSTMAWNPVARNGNTWSGGR
jgi:hypothetical protein